MMSTVPDQAAGGAPLAVADDRGIAEEAEHDDETEDEAEDHDVGYGPAPTIAPPWLHASSVDPNILLKDHLATDVTFMVQACAPPAWYPTDTDGWYNVCVVDGGNIAVHQIRIDPSPHQNSMVAVEDGEEEIMEVHDLLDTIDLLHTACSWWPVPLRVSVPHVQIEDGAVVAAPGAGNNQDVTPKGRWNQAVDAQRNDAEMMKRILDGDVPDEDEVDIPFNLAQGVTSVSDDDSDDGEPDAGYGQSPHAPQTAQAGLSDAADGGSVDAVERASSVRMERLAELSQQLEADTATYSVDRRSSMAAMLAPPLDAETTDEEDAAADAGYGQPVRATSSVDLDTLRTGSSFERASAVAAADAVAAESMVTLPASNYMPGLVYPHAAANACTGMPGAPALTPSPVSTPPRSSTVSKPAGMAEAERRMLDTSHLLAIALANGDAVLVKELRVLLYADVRLSSRMCRDVTA
jgi:hypothetical protein